MTTDSLSAFILAIAFSSCSSSIQTKVDEQNDQLERLVYVDGKVQQINDLKAIFVLTEEGCLPCNRSFGEIIENHLEDSTCLIWVTAMGTGLDISAYRSNEKHVIWDYEDRMRAVGILKGSGVILLQDGRIDTVIQIGNARTVTASLNYLSNRLKSQLSDTLRSELSE